MTRLHTSTLGTVPVTVPDYDRSAVTPAVVHFGVGGFHRAHQAVYFDDVLASGENEWGICGVGVMPADGRARDAARAQNGLYTLVTVDPAGQQNARVIGSIVEYLYTPDDPEQVLEKLAAPTTLIVSLTITEGGYGINDATGIFEPQDALTLADLSSDGPPVSVLGFLTEGLRRRWERGIAPFTVVSCDNIQSNGRVARTALTSFAWAKDQDLAGWIAENVAFPSSMVDRITPVTTDETREAVRSQFGVEDAWPVRSESFTQWVLEDDFPLGRPDLDAVGVQLVDDVEPYELMKLRLLNASHQVMSYAGALAGFRWVHEVSTDGDFIALLRRYMRTEAIPTLLPVPGIDLDEYCDQLLARFGSTAIEDTLDRQMVDTSDRIPKFLLPVLQEQLTTGGPIECSTLTLAAWGLHLEEKSDRGPGELSDRCAVDLLAAVTREEENPGALLDLRAVFGDLGQNPRLRQTYTWFRNQLRQFGARHVVAELAAEVRRTEGRT